MPNPLSAITWATRLQTHVGNGVPAGLWQDVECTIAATQDFDPVAAWTDAVGGTGTIATQSDVAKQPFLFFVDGVPYLVFDGVDDVLLCATSSGISGGVYSIIAVFERVAGGTIVAEDNESSRGFVLRYNEFERNGSQVAGFTTSGLVCVSVVDGKIYVDGVQAQTFDPNISPHSGLTRIAAREYVGYEEFLNGNISSVLITPSILSDANRELAENYLTTLTPDPPAPSGNARVSGLFLGLGLGIGFGRGGSGSSVTPVSNTYLRPSSSSYYLRPGGTDVYSRP